VLSDTHAVDSVEMADAPPRINYGTADAPHPLLVQCRDAVQERYGDEIDLLLAAGDLTDLAGTVPLAKIWADLHWLSGELGCPLVATSGNHDYDSRGIEDVLPNLGLMQLEPSFPFGDSTVRDKYFAQHHALYASTDVVVVTANSSAHHGYSAAAGPEHDHGRFSKILPTFLRDSLDELGTLPQIKVMLTHHHLNQLPGIDSDERAAVVGAENVLATLSFYGDWIVVHGHKHRAWVQYASGGGDAPVLISAASLSADLGDDDFSKEVRHQFHVIEVERDVGDPVGTSTPRGRVLSWTFSPLGWHVASDDDVLPGVTGYGWRGSVHELAHRVRTVVTSQKFLRGDEVAAELPELSYLVFDDLRRLREILNQGSPRVRTLTTDEGEVAELVLEA